MKRLSLALLAALTLATSFFANADATYPFTNPTYIPNAASPSITYSAPDSYLLTINAIGTTTVRVAGTCTSLAATLQASNDGVTFTNINLYPIATGTTAPVAVASISAPGFWKANTSGFSNVKLVMSALTASCTVTMVGAPHGFNGTTF